MASMNPLYELISLVLAVVILAATTVVAIVGVANGRTSDPDFQRGLLTCYGICVPLLSVWWGLKKRRT